MTIARPATPFPIKDALKIRRLDLHDLRVVLAQGWDDFLSKRGDLVFIGVIYPVAILVAGLYAFRASALPLIFPLAAGSILLGPIAASGFYELARRRELGHDMRWRHFLDVVRGPAALPFFSLTSVLVLVFLAWIICAWLIYAQTLGAQMPDAAATAGGFLYAVLTTSAGWRMMVIGNVVGLGFALLTLAISVVSFPMIVDKPVGWSVALRTSFRVAWHNPVTTAVWGLIVVGLLILGSLLAFVGLAVVLPVLGYATWHLYTRAVVR